MKTKLTILAICSVMAASVLQAQTGSVTLAEKLGYAPDAKLLIVHADDIGLNHSTNQATAAAFEKGGISSGSIMVPCPWFAECAAFYSQHQEYDVGIHITLTAEWDFYRWGGVAPSNEIASLLDETGFFYSSVEEVTANAQIEEAEKEIRAQIDRALAFGIRPSHLDTHMGSMAATPELMQLYLKLGMEYGLPVFLPRIFLMAMPAEQRKMIEARVPLVDAFFMLQDAQLDESREKAYGSMIDKMVPGLNVMIVHLAYDNEEMQGVTVNHPAFGSTWRQQDLDYVCSETFRSKLTEEKIQLVSWGQIRDAM